MKFTTIAAMAAGLAIAGSAQAAQVYNVSVWTGAGTPTSADANPGGSAFATFTWTGDINWEDTSAQNSGVVNNQFKNFLDGYTTQLSNFNSSVSLDDFLGAPMTIAGDAYASFFQISRTYTADEFSGTIRHDDGVVLSVDGSPIYSSPAETSVLQHDYTLAGGNHSLQLNYVAGNGTPSILKFASGDSAVPEPATWAMMIVGFGAAGSMVRSARRKQVLALA